MMACTWPAAMRKVQSLEDFLAADGDVQIFDLKHD